MKNHQETAEHDFEDESMDKILKLEFEEHGSSIKDIKAKELSRSAKQIEKSQDSGLFLTNPKEFQTKVSGHFNNTFPREPSSTPLKHVSQSQGIEAIIKEREATI